MIPTHEGPSGDVRFPGSLGVEVSGTIDRPDGPVHATAVFAHCFTCSRESHAASRISKALADRGIAVLRFDFTGLGASEGEFADTSFTSNVGDLVAAARWLGEQLDPPRLMVGHSLGGAAVIAASADLPEVEAVAVLGAPSTPEHVAHIISGLDPGTDREDDPETDPETDPVMAVDIGGRPFHLRRSFLADIRTVDQQERIASLRRPLLVLHAPTDQIVGVDNAREIFDAARHPKSFVALDGADHLLTDRQDASYAAAMISAWASKYVDLPEVEIVREPVGTPPDNGVLVTEIDPTGFTHEARTPAHAWLVDEPPSVGGADRGPNPYDQLLAGLGACTSMTMRMYARRKGWDYGASEVVVTHDRTHAKDCESGAFESGMIDVMHRRITLDPALPAEQREALLRIADKCPVHRTLTGQIQIVTTAY